MQSFLPILINIKNKKCVVIGGGKVAERKIKTLLKYGADITLISPETTESLREIIQKGKIKYIKKKYSKKDLRDAVIVVAATSDSKVNSQIQKEAKFLINCVEQKESFEESNNVEYIVPAVFEKENLKIAISTEFPALSKTIKKELNEIYGKEFASYLKYLKKIRKVIKEKIRDSKERRRLFRKIASNKIVSILRQCGFKKAKEEIDRIIREA